MRNRTSKRDKPKSQLKPQVENKAPVDKRLAAAIARNVKDARAQPPQTSMGGAGNRAVQQQEATRELKHLSNTDYTEWVKLDLWDLHQAVCLCVGIEALHIDSFELNDARQMESRISDANTRLKWRKLCVASMNAMDLGVFQFLPPRKINLPLYRRVKPTEYAAWASKNGFQIPRPLITHLRAPADKGGAIGADKDAAEDTCAPFRAMAGFTADEVSIVFVGDRAVSGVGANNMLEISAGGKTCRVALAALDLIDRRRGGLNSQGVVLLGLAAAKKPVHTPSRAQVITRLRKALKKHLGIKDDPFELYRKGAGWEPRFKIQDKRGAADKRAKREAERHSVSYDQFIEKGEKAADSNQTHQSFDHENDETEDWLKTNDPDAQA